MPDRWKAGIAMPFGGVALLEGREDCGARGFFLERIKDEDEDEEPLFVWLRRVGRWLAGLAACRLEAGATGTRRGSALRWGRGAA